MEFIKKSLRELRSEATVSVVMNASRGTSCINKSFFAAPPRSAENVRIIHRTAEVVTIANSKMQSEILSGTPAPPELVLSRRQVRNHEISRINLPASIVSPAACRANFYALRKLKTTF